eukprot:jgi/Chlat1/5239/Chrsp33S05086
MIIEEVKEEAPAVPAKPVQPKLPQQPPPPPEQHAQHAARSFDDIDDSDDEEEDDYYSAEEDDEGDKEHVEGLREECSASSSHHPAQGHTASHSGARAHRSNEDATDPFSDARVDNNEADHAADEQPEAPMTEEERERLCQQAESLKAEGNAAYSQGDYERASSLYLQALEMAPPDAPQRAIYHCNRAACLLQMEQYANAAKECSSAIKIDASYVKAYIRRANAYEKLDDIDKVYEDWKKVKELDPGNKQAIATVHKLEPRVMELREKQKEEMMGKLKDLGNTVLGKFGLSLDNFKTIKDPNTGSYSVSFQQ